MAEATAAGEVVREYVRVVSAECCLYNVVALQRLKCSEKETRRR